MRAHELDLERMTEEDLIRLMMRDDELFAELSLHVSSENRLMPFIYNEPQRMLDAACRKLHEKHGRVQMIVLKARQMGLSTGIQGRGFKRVITTPNYNMEVISHDDTSALHILGMSKLYYDMLPGNIKPMTRYQPKTGLYFANPDKKAAAREPGLRSGINVTSAKNARAGRSKTTHFLHFSEVAFYDRDPGKLVSGYLQSMPSTVPTEVFMESTANGNEGYFYEVWRDAIKGRGGWNPLFIPWWQMQAYRLPPPHVFVYDKEEERLRERFNLDDSQLWWRRFILHTKCNDDLIFFRQEYPSDWMEAFQSSGSKFFPVQVLQPLFDKYEEEERKNPPKRGTVIRDEAGKPEWVDDPDGWCILHKEPDPSLAYATMVDTSEGTEDEAHDPSGFLVLSLPQDVGKLEEEVFEYNGFLDPDQLAQFAMLVGEWYNWSYIMHEDNNHGITVSHFLRLENYPSVYERETFDDVTQEVTTKLGFRSDAKTKPQILNLLKADLREGKYQPRTTAAIEELLAFKKSKVAFKGGLYSGAASAGGHDERVIIRAMGRLAAQLAPRVPPGRAFNYDTASKNYTRR